MNKHRYCRGFTVMEILVSLIIISVVSGFALTNYNNTRNDSDARVAAIEAMAQTSQDQMRLARKELGNNSGEDPDANCEHANLSVVCSTPARPNFEECCEAAGF
jgi:prepilin-type N-terminal cleavage/methylation domain-containing protein